MQIGDDGLKKSKKYVLILAFILCSFALPGLSVQAGTIYDSPYVSFSPDGFAWTVAEDLPYTDYIKNYDYPENKPEYWYEQDAVIETGITSSLRALRTGEHYYKYDRTGEIPVGYWKIGHPMGWCIHNDAVSEWHGVVNASEKCLKAYYSGWIAYCADCNDVIRYRYMYMSKDAASSITSIDVDKGYYYSCPCCGHLEQTMTVDEHSCSKISWNKYKVVYDANDISLLPQVSSGYMSESYHMYANATEYEGEPVTPATHLSKNQYYCNGYIFTGWNTKPDGSGDSFADEAEIYNLTPYDCNVDGDLGIVTLYAQWQESKSTLCIDPAGGSYDGRKNVTSITQGYMTQYAIQGSKITPPKGYTVSFETNGGTKVPAITGTTHFDRWNRKDPFRGKLINNIYTYFAPNGNIDTISAVYAPDSITLPGTKKAGYTFGGWYYDEGFTLPAGGEGDTITPTGDITLYAQWVNLRLYSKDNYIANSKKGAVDLTWEQPDTNHKTYRIYQSTEPGMDEDTRKEVNTATDVGNTLSVKEEFAHTGKEQTYTVPYSGFYQLTAYGAQGEDWGSYSGGKGGMVTGTFYLKAGDTLKYIVGGQGDTATGAGKGSSGGSGGGYTRVSVISDGVETLLLVAGGGGGATTFEDGRAGGSTEYLRADGVSEGQSGASGGGGGYIGGAAD